jgi:hypothetical protein
MTAKFWVFGDSFGCDLSDYPGRRRDQLIDLELPVWPDLLCRKLGMEYRNFAVSGSAIEYSQWQWNQQKANFNPGDIVTLILTEPSRVWFDRAQPENAHSFSWLEQLDKQCAKSILNLVDPDIKGENLASWVGHAILHAQHNGYRLVIVPAFIESQRIVKTLFEDLTQVPGCCVWLDINLYELSVLELHPAWRYKSPLMFSGDIRNGHFTATNHGVLADLIHRAINAQQHNMTWDLKQNFVAEILNPDTLRDHDFLCRELGSWYTRHNRRIQSALTIS